MSRSGAWRGGGGRGGGSPAVAAGDRPPPVAAVVEGRECSPSPLLLGPTPPHLAGTGAKEGARGGVGGGDRRPVRRCRCLSLRLSGGGGCGGPPGGGGGGGEEVAAAVGRHVRCVCESRKRFEGETAC